MTHRDGLVCGALGIGVGLCLGLIVLSGNRSVRRNAAPPNPNAAFLPNPKLTPGDTLPVNTADLCLPGYAKKVRDVPAKVKAQVYAEYGITKHAPGEYEVDHLISLELGGSNSLKNLWPESYRTQPYNAHVKDRLEDRLHALVCSGQLDLKTAQTAIATDWIGAYGRYLLAPSTPR